MQAQAYKRKTNFIWLPAWNNRAPGRVIVIWFRKNIPVTRLLYSFGFLQLVWYSAADNARKKSLMIAVILYCSCALNAAMTPPCCVTGHRSFWVFFSRWAHLAWLEHTKQCCRADGSDRECKCASWPPVRNINRALCYRALRNALEMMLAGCDNHDNSSKVDRGRWLPIHISFERGAAPVKISSVFSVLFHGARWEQFPLADWSLCRKKQSNCSLSQR